MTYGGGRPTDHGAPSSLFLIWCSPDLFLFRVSRRSSTHISTRKFHPTTQGRTCDTAASIFRHPADRRHSHRQLRGCAGGTGSPCRPTTMPSTALSIYTRSHSPRTRPSFGGANAHGQDPLGSRHRSARSMLYYQSQVPQHAELSWILGTFAGMGHLGRMTQYKEKGNQGRCQPRNIRLPRTDGGRHPAAPGSCGAGGRRSDPTSRVHARPGRAVQRRFGDLFPAARTGDPRDRRPGDVSQRPNPEDVEVAPRRQIEDSRDREPDTIRAKIRSA